MENYHSEDSIIVARQLKIVSQRDAFTFSAARNIQCVLRKHVCFIVFVKDIFDFSRSPNSNPNTYRGFP